MGEPTPQNQPNAEAYNKAIRELTDLSLKLRRLDKAKDEFISIASHELRNPMAIIKGTLSMILDGDEGEINEKIKKDLQEVMLVVEREIRLVNELLDVSRIESGVIYFNLVDNLNVINLANLLADSLNRYGVSHGVKIIVKESSLPPVQGDQDKVSQILINLVTNALKFTKEGTIIVSFEVKGDFLETNVTDTGSGMPEETKKELFQKFTKPGDPTVGTMSAGSGLGLYICKKYVQHLGGELWLKESTLGKGSTFSFTLPISNSPTAKKVAEEVSHLQGLITSNKIKGGKNEQNSHG